MRRRARRCWRTRVEQCPAAFRRNIEVQTATFEVDPVDLWGTRLSLWLRRRMWMSQWGPRPDQDGCLVPHYLL
jgi:hypothetical protein